MLPSAAVHRTISSWALVGLITLVLLESALRFGFTAQLGDARAQVLASEERFIQRDAVTGWSNRPDTSGTFTNGRYAAQVHTGARGVRLNAPSSTIDSGAPTTFLIGDSNAAGFEVNDNLTLAALLERDLRDKRGRANVLNLGVRGYGTDQAVLRALAFGDLAPKTVLYLFTNNDPFDTNVLHLPGREYGKGTFIRRTGAASFEPYHYPVPVYAAGDAGVVVFDGQCQPIVHEQQADTTPDPPRLGAFLKRRLWSARAVSLILHGVPALPELNDDPLALLDGGARAFHPDLYTTYHEHGAVRMRCAEYFESQMRDLLSRLRRMPSVERVLVAHFPDNETFAWAAAGRPVPSTGMFQHLLADGTIDGYVNLGERFVDERLDYPALACPGDGHLCAEGIAWEARTILSALGRLL
jgi:hypothetical protein